MLFKEKYLKIIFQDMPLKAQQKLKIKCLFFKYFLQMMNRREKRYLRVLIQFSVVLQELFTVMISYLLTLKTLVILAICRLFIKINTLNYILLQEVFSMHKLRKEIHNLNQMMNKRNKIITLMTQEANLRNNHLIHNIILKIIKEYQIFLLNKKQKKYNLHLLMLLMKLPFKYNKISEDL